MIKTYSLKKDANLLLSPHFKVKEFKSGDGADTVLIDTDLIDILEKVYAHFNCKYIIINSGYRTPKNDIAVGGNGTGQHVLGRACDFKCMGQDNNWIDAKLICCYLEDLNCKGIALINYRSVHLDTRTGSKYWGDETINFRSIWYIRPGCYSFYDYFGIARQEKPKDPIVEAPKEPVEEPIIEPIEPPIEEHEEIPIEEPIVEEDKPNEAIEPKTNWLVELVKTIIKFIQDFLKGDKK